MDPISGGIAAIGSLFSGGSALATGLGIAGAGLGLLGGMAQTGAEVDSLKAQQRAAEYNQRLSLENKGIAEGQTAAALEKADRERRLRLGMSRAGAGSGGRSGSGSFLDIMQDNIAQETLNLLTIRSEGLLRQKNYQDEANLYGMEATGISKQIPKVKRAGLLGAASTALTGVSSVLGKR